ncbi:Mini-ribonuclease 3 [Aerococcaceae bacterium WGS1372]
MNEKANLLNGAALAYIGDAVYEVFVRDHVISQGETSPNKLHKAAVKYVEAKGQAEIMKHWLTDDDFLSEQEITMYKRGRNNKANTKAKNASIGDYRQATGFESLIGWLHMTRNEERLNELLNAAIQYIDERQGGLTL